MNTTRKIFEIAYLLISLLFFYEAFTRWSTEPSKSYLFIGFAILAIFMFFFRRRFRKKSESYHKNTK